MSSKNKTKKNTLKIYILFYMLLIISVFFIKINGLVFADETYTCKANNVSSFYCSLLNDEMQAKYGCTVTKSDNGCSGTCTKLTAADIEKFGPYLNISINDCTKNGTAATATPQPTATPKPTATPAPSTSISPTTSSNSGAVVVTPNTSNNNNNNNNNTNGSDGNNPQTGSTWIIFVWMIGIAAISYSIIYYKRMINGNFNGLE